MSATVHVQHLSRYLARLREIENRVDDVLYLPYPAHWLQRLENVFRIILMRRCTHDARRDGVEANASLCILDCELTRHRIEAE